MKKTTLIIFVSLFLFNCNNQSEILKNDLTRQKLKGEIKAFTESEYTVSDKFGVIKKEHLYFKYISQLNNFGNLLEENIYDEINTSDDKKVTFKYNENGILIEKLYFQKNNILSQREKFKYDNLGNRIEKASFNSDGSLSLEINFKI